MENMKINVVTVKWFDGYKEDFSLYRNSVLC